MIDHGKYTYSQHNHLDWIDESHNKLYMDHELDTMFLRFDTPIFIFNITNLSSISLGDNLEQCVSSTPVTPHNYYVMSDYFIKDIILHV